MAPLATTVLSRIGPQHVGAASGVLNTGIQIGNAIGVAIIGVVFYGTLANGAPPDHARAFSFSLVYLVSANLLLAALVQSLHKGAETTAESR